VRTAGGASSLGSYVISGGGGGATRTLRAARTELSGRARGGTIDGGGGVVSRGTTVWSQRRGIGVLCERIEAFGGLIAGSLEALP
jgi:hypothetical protein